jgi:hypothetical protein
MKPESSGASAVIQISVHEGRCRSHTEPYTVKVKPSDSIEWDVVDDGKALNGASIELRFDRDNSPLSHKRPKNTGKIQDKAKRRVKAGVYKYEVWYVGADGTDYPMEDPEIEIVF